MRVVVGIPARMGSSRFPGKPLCDILGKSMIEHIYRRCELSDIYTFVATCDKEIYYKVKEFGGEVFMTDPDIKRPGLRVAQACKQLDLDDDDIVIIVQGDEPLVHPDMIQGIINELVIDNNKFCVHNMRKATQEELDDTNEVKAVFDVEKYALYFSRSAIPSNIRTEDIPRYKQVCIFGFIYKNLKQFLRLEPTPIEIAESIEMMRVLEHGYRLKLIETDKVMKSVDTEEDRKEVELLMKDDELWKKGY